MGAGQERNFHFWSSPKQALMSQHRCWCDLTVRTVLLSSLPLVADGSEELCERKGHCLTARQHGWPQTFRTEALGTHSTIQHLHDSHIPGTHHCTVLRQTSQWGENGRLNIYREQNKNYGKRRESCEEYQHQLLSDRQQWESKSYPTLPRSPTKCMCVCGGGCHRRTCTAKQRIEKTLTVR